MAGYSGGKLISIESRLNPDTSGEKFIAPKQVDRIKIMLWDYNTLTPLCNNEHIFSKDFIFE